MGEKARRLFPARAFFAAVAGFEFLAAFLLFLAVCKIDGKRALDRYGIFGFSHLTKLFNFSCNNNTSKRVNL
ncbi:MAG: hypothetical protein K0S33_3331 [Bacteroidetes bacterium]|jgi:hypothetical protein|nr:hypothetical protein [Bacteroidota bacterium]